MNESGPKQNQDIASYENQVKKGYSELGEDGLDAKHWGTAKSRFTFDVNLWGGFNFYTNKDYIDENFVEHLLIGLTKRKENNQLSELVMADLGGDDGFLLNEITKTLKQKLPDIKISSFVVDLDPTGKAQEKFKTKSGSGDREGLGFITSDVTSLPFADKSLDVVVSRMTMQYLSPEQQEKFYFEISRVLRDGGLAQITTVEAGEEYNKILEEITFIISGSHNFNRSFPNFDKFLDLEEKLSQSGSSLRLTFRQTDTEMPLSVESFADRFKLDDEKIKRLKELYDIKSKEHPDLFEVVDGVLCLKTEIIFQQYEKSSD